MWVFGAVEPLTGWCTAMATPVANSETMQCFLDRVAKQIRPREHAVMVLDRAGWHRSKQLRWPKRITPLLLPPYSPELNCIERVWLWLRQHHWSNRCYEDEAALVRAVRESRAKLTRGRVRSICRTSWLTPADFV